MQKSGKGYNKLGQSKEISGLVHFISIVIFTVCILNAKQGLAGARARMLLDATKQQVPSHVSTLSMFPTRVTLVWIIVVGPNAIRVSVYTHFHGEGIGASNVGIVWMNENARWLRFGPWARTCGRGMGFV